MRKRSKRSKSLKQISAFSFIFLLLLVLVVSTIGRKEFSSTHKFILEIIGGAQSGVTKVMASFENVWLNYIALWDVREENELLRNELQKYKTLNNKYREAVALNVRLEKLLGLKETLPPPTLTAQIVGKDPTQWFKTIMVNRGAGDGVQKGMPVVTTEGIVGQVMNTSPNHCKILLANDPNSAIDVLIQKTRVQGIIKGKDSFYKLHYVLKNNVVTEGDRIVTSGLGGIFPKGLPVGKVSSVTSNRRGMFQLIEVDPAVDFSRLEYIVIILKPSLLTE